MLLEPAVRGGALLELTFWPDAPNAAFVSSGNSFAGMRLAARNSLTGYIGETTQGVTYYESVRRMLTDAKDDWPSLLARLKTLRDTLLSQAGAATT